MRPKIVMTYFGKYEVKYDIAECYEYWLKEGKHLLSVATAFFIMVMWLRLIQRKMLRDL